MRGNSYNLPQRMPNSAAAGLYARGAGAPQYGAHVKSFPQVSQPSTVAAVAAAPQDPSSLLVSFESVMTMNRRAMDALRAGDMAHSHAVLSEALAMAEQGLLSLEEMEKNYSREKRGKAAKSEQKKNRDAWLLAYSMTLSNLGCQLRRDNKHEAALAALQDARDVETQLLGKPSCSTMMNLSAVHLGMGSVTQALPIAKDCVAASQKGDAVLFITALHNLAVTLGQQPQARERKAALPTMLRALREAQSHLGEHHATTVMLKEKCGMTQPWIVEGNAAAKNGKSQSTVTVASANNSQKAKRQDSKSPTRRQTGALTRGSAAASVGAKSTNSVSATRAGSGGRGRPRSNSSTKRRGDSYLMKRPLSRGSKGQRLQPLRDAGLPLDPRAHERARVALSTLDFGMPEQPCLLDSYAEQQAPELVHEHPPECQSLTSTSSHNMMQGAISPSLNASALYTSSQPLSASGIFMSQQQQQRGVPALPPISSQNDEQLADTLLETGSIHSRGSAAAMSDAPDRAFPVSVVVRSSVDLLCESTFSSFAAIETSFGYLHGDGSSGGGGAMQHNSSAHLVNLADGRQPSYLRFAAIEDGEEDEVDSTYVTYQHIREKLRRVRDAQVTVMQRPRQGRSIKGSEGTNTTEVVMSTVTTATTLLSARSTFKAVSSKEAKETRKELQRREEAAYRERRARQTAAEEEEARFQQALKRIYDRTENRAACAIQYLWTSWWGTVGSLRRAAQLKRAEEREKRLRERLALQAEQDASRHGRGRNAAKQKMGRKKVAGMAAPEMVVKCAKKWMGRTECLRYLARNAISHRDRKEADVRALVVRLQAWWRGVLLRRGVRVSSTVFATLPGTGYATMFDSVTGEILREFAIEDATVVDANAVDDVTASVIVPTVHHRDSAGTMSKRELAEAIARHEEREYAALVIQKMYRCFAARRTREALRLDRFVPVVRAIEEWFLRVVNDQRGRGVDSRSVRRRSNAALVIQKTWRGYQQRIAFYMAKLRDSIDYMRRREKSSVCLVQRVGRGFAARKRLGFAQADGIMASIHQSRLDEEGAERQVAAASARALLETSMGTRTYPPLVIPRTAYEAECLERAPEIAKIREADREQYDVALYSQPLAEKERQAWSEAIRLRPSEVERRRANEDFRTQLEWNTMYLDRAASKIQRAFRGWCRHRDDRKRERTLLLISRGKYQQRELERQYQRKQFAKEQERARTLHGDNAEKVRQYRLEAEQELRRLEASMPRQLPESSVRSKFERKVDEAVLVRDEVIVSSTYPVDMLRLREDPEEVKARTRAVYELPYYRPAPTDEYRRALGLDV